MLHEPAYNPAPGPDSVGVAAGEVDVKEASTTGEVQLSCAATEAVSAVLGYEPRVQPAGGNIDVALALHIHGPLTAEQSTGVMLLAVSTRLVTRSRTRNVTGRIQAQLPPRQPRSRKARRRTPGQGQEPKLSLADTNRDAGCVLRDAVTPASPSKESPRRFERHAKYAVAGRVTRQGTKVSMETTRRVLLCHSWRLGRFRIVGPCERSQPTRQRQSWRRHGAGGAEQR